jgi:hypothetical protein
LPRSFNAHTLATLLFGEIIMVTAVRIAPTPSKLTPNQVRGFWAAWGGWALDGMDASIYAVVLVPALAELLPRSGIAATPANTGYYGSVLLALFLFGWGLSMVWGPVADRFGPRPRPDAHHPVLFAVHISVCVRDQ